jgi:hypothetical protein
MLCCFESYVILYFKAAGPLYQILEFAAVWKFCFKNLWWIAFPFHVLFLHKQAVSQSKFSRLYITEIKLILETKPRAGGAGGSSFLKYFNLFELTWYFWTAAVCLSTVFILFLATSLPFVYLQFILVYFYLLRCRLTVCSIVFGLFMAASLPFINTVYISGYFAAVCLSTVFISIYCDSVWQFVVYLLFYF